jgi:hypothetical protein
MLIVISKDNGPASFVPTWNALTFYRAFRSELWANGIKRDPKPGDELLGVKIIALTIGA